MGDVDQYHPGKLKKSDLKGQSTLIVGGAGVGKTWRIGGFTDRLFETIDSANTAVSSAVTDEPAESMNKNTVDPDALVVVDNLYTALEGVGGEEKAAALENVLAHSGGACVTVRPRELDWLFTQADPPLPLSTLQTFDQVVFLSYDIEEDAEDFATLITEGFCDSDAEADAGDPLKKSTVRDGIEDGTLRSPAYTFSDEIADSLGAEAYPATLVPGIVAHLSLNELEKAIVPGGLDIPFVGELKESISYVGSGWPQRTADVVSDVLGNVPGAAALTESVEEVSRVATDAEVSGTTQLLAASGLSTSVTGVPAILTAAGMVYCLGMRWNEVDVGDINDRLDVLASERFTPPARAELERQLELPPRTLDNLVELAAPENAQVLRELANTDPEQLTAVQEYAEEYAEVATRLDRLDDELGDELVETIELVADHAAAATRGLESIGSQMRRDRATYLGDLATPDDIDLDRVDLGEGDPVADIVEAIADDGYEIVVLGGPKGTGKTTAVHAAGKGLETRRNDTSTYKMIAPDFGSHSPGFIRQAIERMGPSDDVVIYVPFGHDPAGISLDNPGPALRAVFEWITAGICAAAIVECRAETVTRLRDRAGRLSQAAADEGTEGPWARRKSVEFENVDETAIEGLARSVAASVGREDDLDEATLAEICRLAAGNPEVAIIATRYGLDDQYSLAEFETAGRLIRRDLRSVLEDDEDARKLVRALAVAGTLRTDEVIALLDVENARMLRQRTQVLAGYVNDDVAQALTQRRGRLLGTERWSLSPSVYAEAVFMGLLDRPDGGGFRFADPEVFETYYQVAAIVDEQRARRVLVRIGRQFGTAYRTARRYHQRGLYDAADAAEGPPPATTPAGIADAAARFLEDVSEDVNNARQLLAVHREIALTGVPVPAEVVEKQFDSLIDGSRQIADLANLPWVRPLLVVLAEATATQWAAGDERMVERYRSLAASILEEPEPGESQGKPSDALALYYALLGTSTAEESPHSEKLPGTVRQRIDTVVEWTVAAGHDRDEALPEGIASAAIGRAVAELAHRQSPDTAGDWPERAFEQLVETAGDLGVDPSVVLARGLGIAVGGIVGPRVSFVLGGGTDATGYHVGGPGAYAPGRGEPGIATGPWLERIFESVLGAADEASAADLTGIVRIGLGAGLGNVHPARMIFEGRVRALLDAVETVVASRIDGAPDTVVTVILGEAAGQLAAVHDPETVNAWFSHLIDEATAWAGRTEALDDGGRHRFLADMYTDISVAVATADGADASAWLRAVQHHVGSSTELDADVAVTPTPPDDDVRSPSDVLDTMPAPTEGIQRLADLERVYGRQLAVAAALDVREEGIRVEWDLGADAHAEADAEPERDADRGGSESGEQADVNTDRTALDTTLEALKSSIETDEAPETAVTEIIRHGAAALTLLVGHNDSSPISVDRLHSDDHNAATDIDPAAAMLRDFVDSSLITLAEGPPDESTYNGIYGGAMYQLVRGSDWQGACRSLGPLAGALSSVATRSNEPSSFLTQTYGTALGLIVVDINPEDTGEKDPVDTDDATAAAFLDRVLSAVQDGVGNVDDETGGDVAAADVLARALVAPVIDPGSGVPTAEEGTAAPKGEASGVGAADAWRGVLRAASVDLAASADDPEQILVTLYARALTPAFGAIRSEDLTAEDDMTEERGTDADESPLRWAELIADTLLEALSVSELDIEPADVVRRTCARTVRSLTEGTSIEDTGAGVQTAVEMAAEVLTDPRSSIDDATLDTATMVADVYAGAIATVEHEWVRALTAHAWRAGSDDRPGQLAGLVVGRAVGTRLKAEAACDDAWLDALLADIHPAGGGQGGLFLRDAVSEAVTTATRVGRLQAVGPAVDRCLIGICARTPWGRDAQGVVAEGVGRSIPAIVDRGNRRGTSWIEGVADRGVALATADELGYDPASFLATTFGTVPVLFRLERGYSMTERFLNDLGRTTINSAESVGVDPTTVIGQTFGVVVQSFVTQTAASPVADDVRSLFEWLETMPVDLADASGATELALAHSFEAMTRWTGAEGETAGWPDLLVDVAIEATERFTEGDAVEPTAFLEDVWTRTFDRLIAQSDDIHPEALVELVIAVVRTADGAPGEAAPGAFYREVASKVGPNKIDYEWVEALRAANQTAAERTGIEEIIGAFDT